MAAISACRADTAVTRSSVAVLQFYFGPASVHLVFIYAVVYVSVPGPVYSSVAAASYYLSQLEMYRSVRNMKFYPTFYISL